MSVHKTFTGHSHISYHDRIHKLGLESLELQWLKSDLLFVYKILFGLVDVDKMELFSLCYSVTWGHNYKLSVQYSCTTVEQP